MHFLEATKNGFSNYVTWKGRASRSEYWFFYLSYGIAFVIAAVLDNLLGTDFSTSDPYLGEVSAGYGILAVIVILGFFLPCLSVLVRRLHDTNRSGWWYWLSLVPLVGVIVLLVFLCTKGTDGPNNFGEDPLGNLNEKFL